MFFVQKCMYKYITNKQKHIKKVRNIMQRIKVLFSDYLHVAVIDFEYVYGHQVGTSWVWPH